MTWQQLGFEVGLEYTGETVKKALRSMNYRKCVSCKKGWVNEKTARDRKAWAEVMKAKYPRPEGWYRMRFSDEVHFGYGPQAKLRIIRKPRERYCPDCIQEDEDPEEKDKNRHHCWAVAGHNFKLEIYFYDVSGNTNGKMSERSLSILIRILGQLSSPGSMHITILCWKKTVTPDMGPENRTLYGLASRKTTWSATSTVTHLLI